MTTSFPCFPRWPASDDVCGMARSHAASAVRAERGVPCHAAAAGRRAHRRPDQRLADQVGARRTVWRPSPAARRVAPEARPRDRAATILLAGVIAGSHAFVLVLGSQRARWHTRRSRVPHLQPGHALGSSAAGGCRFDLHRALNRKLTTATLDTVADGRRLGGDRARVQGGAWSCGRRAAGTRRVPGAVALRCPPMTGTRSKARLVRRVARPPPGVSTRCSRALRARRLAASAGARRDVRDAAVFSERAPAPTRLLQPAA